VAAAAPFIPHPNVNIRTGSRIKLIAIPTEFTINGVLLSPYPINTLEKNNF
jgi:hypothetical protein